MPSKIFILASIKCPLKYIILSLKPKDIVIFCNLPKSKCFSFSIPPPLKKYINGLKVETKRFSISIFPPIKYINGLDVEAMRWRIISLYSFYTVYIQANMF